MIQNGAGANSAIWVIGDGVAVGDQVEVAGTVNEVFGLRQIFPLCLRCNLQEIPCQQQKRSHLVPSTMSSGSACW